MGRPRAAPGRAAGRPLAGDDRSRFATGDLPTTTTRAGAGLLLDDLLDMAHVLRPHPPPWRRRLRRHDTWSYVHAATIGVEEEPLVGAPDIERDGLAMTVRSPHRFPNREDPEVLAGRRPLLQTRHVTYRYTAPFSATLRIDHEEAGGSNVITFLLTAEVHTRADRATVELRRILADLVAPASSGSAA